MIVGAARVAALLGDHNADWRSVEFCDAEKGSNPVILSGAKDLHLFVAGAERSSAVC